jgi:hypothetical protein
MSTTIGIEQIKELIGESGSDFCLVPLTLLLVVTLAGR